MNKNLYKIIFSKVRNAYVVVSDCASNISSSGRPARSFSLQSAPAQLGTGLSLSFMLMASAWAAPAVPQGGVVAQGNVAISQNGNVVTVNQSTDKAIVNWQSFSIGTGAAVNIVQPGASSTHLSRVTGNDPSVIQGQLQSNGQVVLVNPNGIVVGKDGSVSANSFTASTLNITDADFMAGKYQYARNGANGEVINQGKIETAAGGYVALLGAKVSNEGTITSQQGAVYLGAGDAVAVPVTGSGRIKFEVSPAAINTSVSNNKDAVIVAEGGQVYMRAASLNDLAVASVQQTGSIDVSGAKSGNVTVLADKGQIKATGTIKANSTGTTNGTPNKGGNVIIGRDVDTGVLAASTDVSSAKLQAKDGFVETSADYLETAGIQVQAKTWLLDPVNVEINATSTPVTAGNSVVLASDISTTLSNGTDVTISTVGAGSANGDISVNDNISKTAGGDASLTLIANRNINVSGSKTITSTSGKVNVVFNANASDTGGGIQFGTAAGITSNGGNITLGGGSAQNGTGFAIADGASTLQGIALYTANINAGGGNIVMNGKTATSNYSGNLSNISGFFMSGGSISTTGSGTINLSGLNQNIDTQSRGLVMTGGTITGGSIGAVTITGDSRQVTSSTFTDIKGALINGTVTSTGGNINIIGFGGAGQQYDNGVDIGGSVIAVGSGAINITGTASTGGSGGNIGVLTSGAGTISSVDGDILITGTGGVGNGAVIRNHGVQISGSNAIRSTGVGNISVTGRAINNDTVYSLGVTIGGAGLVTNSGDIKLDGQVLNNYQIAVSISSALTATSGDVYVRSANAGIVNSATGIISGYNVSIDNTGGSIDANGVITKGAGGATTWAGQVARNGIDLAGSVTAANNLNMYGNQTNTEVGVRMSGATTTVSGKNVTIYGNSGSSGKGIYILSSATLTGDNVTIYGNSSTGNGLLLEGATLSGQYINATGATNTGYTGFAWNGGNINTIGTAGTSTASIIKGTSAATSTLANGYGAFMMFGNGAVVAATGTSLTLAGEASTLTTGQNIKVRGILVQGGRTLTASGDITIDGSSKSSEGISFGGTINMATVAGVTNKLTLKGTAAASSNASLNALNFSGVINGNAATSSINFIGEAKNLSGGSIDNAINLAGTVNGNATNVNVQALYGKMVVGGTISATNISIDNTNGTINSSTGAVTAGAGTSNYTNAISVTGALTATANINVLARVATTTNTGITVSSAGSMTSTGTATSINLDSNGNVQNSGALKVTGATGTGSSINLLSSNGAISESGAIGDTTNKNSNVTFTQAGTSSYSGAINAANFNKSGAGALTLSSWLSGNLTKISNAYTVNSGSLALNSDLAILNYPTFAPASVNVVNASTFSLAASGNGRWNNTAFNFTGGSGGGTMNLGGNPIGALSTTNTFSTSGGATNTITRGFNANGANVNFNLATATSGTALLDGSYAAIVFTENPVGGNGLASATTVNMSGGGHLLFKDKVSSTNTFNINAGNVQVGDGSAVTAAATATLDAANISIAAGSKLTFNRAESYSNASVITGTGSLIQAGTGVVTLTGNSSAFAGATTVNAGKTLAIGSTGASEGSLGAAGSTLFLRDSAAQLRFTNTTGTSVVGSTISGAGSLTSNGAGGVGVLTADNTYTGITKIDAGTLQVGNGGTVGSLGSYAGAITNNGTLAYNLSRDITVANTITGTGAFAQIGSGTTTLTANNSYTGTTSISGGTLQVGDGGSTGSLGFGGDVTLSNNASLNYQRNTSTIIANNISGTGNVSALLTGASSELTVNNTIALTGGTINLVTDGDVSLKNALSTTNATDAAIILIAGQSVSAGNGSGGNVVASGSGAISLSSPTARATIYTGSTAFNTGLTIPAGNNRYGSDEIDANYTAALGAGQYAIYRERPTVQIAFNNVTKTYDGLAYSGSGGYQQLGLKSSDTNASLTGTLSVAGNAQGAVNVGTYSINGSGLTSTVGYDLTYAAGDLVVNKAPVTLTLTSLSTVYGTVAPLTYSVNGLVNNETALTAGVTVSGVQSSGYTSASTTNNVGNYAITASGLSAQNYELSGASSIIDGTLSITPATLTFAPNAASRYVTRQDPALSFAVSGLVNGDTSSAYTAPTISRAAGELAGTYLISLSGGAASNYTLDKRTNDFTILAAFKVNIEMSNASTIYGTLGTASIVNVSYLDSNNDVILNLTKDAGTTWSDGVGGNIQITPDLNGVTASSNVGLYSNAVTAIHSGTTYANNNFNGVFVTRANYVVDPKALNIAADNITRTYDGTSFTGSVTPNGFVLGQDINTLGGVTYSGNAIGSRNVGSYTYAPTVVNSSGAAASNYTITYTGGTLDTTARLVTISGMTINTKVYDGTRAATANLSNVVLGNIVSGDNVTLNSPTATFDTANADTGKTVTLNSQSISGADSGNYTLINNGVGPNLTYMGDITQKAVSISTNSASSVYTGFAQSLGSASVSGVIAGESITTARTGGTLTNIGTSTSSTTATAGANTSLSNYAINISEGSLTVTPALLRVLAVEDTSRVFNGATQSQGVTIDGVLGNDQITVTGLVSQRDAGNYYSSLSITGAALGNYTQDIVNASFNIAKANATVNINSNTTTYNGATQSVSGFSTDGVLGGDSIVVSGDMISGRNASTYLSQATASHNNYNLTVNQGSLVINQAPLVVSGLLVSDKVYDATTSATIDTSAMQLNGLFGSDDVQVTITSATFNNADVGTNKPVLLASSVSGVDQSNYIVTSQSTAVGRVTPAPLSLTGITAEDKIADGTTVATLNFSGASFQGLKGSDQMSVDGSGNFISSDIGSNKPVQLSLNISSQSLGNYLLTSQELAYASISAANSGSNNGSSGGNTTPGNETNQSSFNGINVVNPTARLLASLDFQSSSQVLETSSIKDTAVDTAFTLSAETSEINACIDQASYVQGLTSIDPCLCESSSKVQENSSGPTICYVPVAQVSRYQDLTNK